MDSKNEPEEHIALLYDIIGEWGSNRFGYSYKRAHFTEKALHMAEAIGRPLEEVHAVFKNVVMTKMKESIGPVEPVDLSPGELNAVYRKVILYLFSYGFPYGTEFPSGPNAMRASVEGFAKLIDVPMETLYPVWAAIVYDAIEWSFEPIPDDLELPNEDDWRERKRERG